jgi:hypothetical protein
MFKGSTENQRVKMKKKICEITPAPPCVIMVGAQKYSIFPAHPTKTKVISDAGLIIK